MTGPRPATQRRHARSVHARLPGAGIQRASCSAQADARRNGRATDSRQGFPQRFPDTCQLSLAVGCIRLVAIRHFTGESLGAGIAAPLPIRDTGVLHECVGVAAGGEFDLVRCALSGIPGAAGAVGRLIAQPMPWYSVRMMRTRQAKYTRQNHVILLGGLVLHHFDPTGKHTTPIPTATAPALLHRRRGRRQSRSQASPAGVSAVSEVASSPARWSARPSTSASTPMASPGWRLLSGSGGICALACRQRDSVDEGGELVAQAAVLSSASTITVSSDGRLGTLNLWRYFPEGCGQELSGGDGTPVLQRLPAASDSGAGRSRRPTCRYGIRPAPA